MEVKAGYRQTAEGMVPEDWDVKHLGDLASVTAGGTPSRGNPRYWNGGVPWVTTAEVDFCTISQTEQSITTEGLKNCAAKLHPAGTILMALYGQGKTRGKVGVLGIEASTNQACAAICVNPTVFRDFVFHSLASRYEAIRNLSNTGNQENLSGSIVRSIPVLLPPAPEQHAIAAALNDMDALLGALEKLIAKKRDLKQGAMQQLLTGKTRLPGFDDQWDLRRFGDIAAPRPERLDPRRAGLQSFCVELENIGQGNGRLLGSTTTGEKSSMKAVFREGDVLFGRLRAYLRKYWLANRDGVCSTEIWALVARRQEVTPSYLFQMVQTRTFLEAATAAYGTHMPRSDWSVIRNHEAILPGTDEQTAIAGVLSDMNAEIAALEVRLAKTRAVKQGMMQELLTGRVRLPVPA